MLPAYIRCSADIEKNIEEYACPIGFDVKSAGRFGKFFAKHQFFGVTFKYNHPN